MTSQCTAYTKQTHDVHAIRKLLFPVTKFGDGGNVGSPSYIANKTSSIFERKYQPRTNDNAFKGS